MEKCPSVSEVSVLTGDVATLPVAEVAILLDQPESRVHQLVRDGQILSLRRDGEVVVPADFLDTTEERAEVVRGLPGTIIVFRDGGYTDPEILRWLFTEDDSLPGATPMASLCAGHQREVKRRAQAMGF